MTNKIIKKKLMLKSNILILTGEHSGDLLGGELIKEIKKIKKNLHFFGVGGSEMSKEGVESYADIEQMTVVGFSGILTKYNFLKNLLNTLVDDAVNKKAIAAILIDYPGFNLRLAEKLKQNGIKVIYYASPQIWAWKFNRIFKIRDNVNLMMTLFKFEETLYKEYNVNAVFVGHPVMYRIPNKIKEENNKEGRAFSNLLTIVLMPGSRNSEISRLLSDLLNAAVLIQNSIKEQIRFIVPNINEKEESYILNEIEKYKDKINIDYCFNCSLHSIKIADLVILSSGTATLEVTWFVKPMIIIYKISWLTWILGKLLVKAKFIGLVNILAGEEICKELIQLNCKPELIHKEAIEILKNDQYRSQMMQKIKQVKNNLSAGMEPSKLAALEVIKLINESVI